MAQLALTLFGAPIIQLAGNRVHLERQKSLALLAYLAVTQQPQRRDHLAALFWPDVDQTRARASLRRTLSTLHLALGDPLFSFRDADVALNSAALWVDVCEFRRCVTDAGNGTHSVADETTLLRQAAALYGGDFLQGFSVRAAPEFEAWLRTEADALARLAAQAFDRLSALCAAQGELPEAIEYADRWARLDALGEPAQMRLMQLHARAGHPSAVRQHYAHYAHLLATELDMAPSVELNTFYQQAIGDAVTPATPIAGQGQPSVPSSPDASPLTLSLPGSVPSTSSPPVAIPFAMPRFLVDAAAVPRGAPNLCVAREEPLSRLYSYLSATLAGRTQVVFVTGEAGTGKSTFVREFMQRAVDEYPDLLAAYGRCDAYAGIGDAYLPFRTVLAALTGAVEEQWGAGILTRTHAMRLWDCAPGVTDVLLDHGPDLLGTLVKSAGLVARMAARRPAQGHAPVGPLPDNAPSSIDQAHLFEQYLAVLRVLATRHPLLLVLDDLHWADTASLGLLFFLGRQLLHARVLILATYRPEEVAVEWRSGGHPLPGISDELRRIYGDSEISLDHVVETGGRAFIDALLATMPNRLDHGFRQELYLHSRGHPLFTVELLHNMQENRQLIQDADGEWVTGENLSWEMWPAKVEGVIGKRLDRLDAELLETLRIASVEGEQFTAEIVAAVQGTTPQEIVRRLSGDLAKRHRLVLPHGIRRLDGQLLSYYRFRHNLFQQYLLQNLDEVERAHIHARMGTAMESVYGADADELSARAGQIALHLEAGGMADKAVNYWEQAGEEAVRLSANEEAIRCFSNALKLLFSLPNDAGRSARELRLQLSLGVPVSAVHGYSDHATAKVYRRAYILCRHAGNLEEEFPSLYGLWRYYLIRAQMKQAHRTAERLLVLSRALEQSAIEVEALRAVGVTYFHGGVPVKAQTYLMRSLALYDRERDGAHAYLYGHDPAISCHSYMASALWIQGQDEQALRFAHEGLALAKQLDHPFSLTHALINGAAQLHTMRRDFAAARAMAEAGLTVATRHRFPQWTGYAQVLLGRAMAGQGACAEGVQRMRAGLAVLDELGMLALRGFFLAQLAEGLLDADDVAGAQEILGAALSLVDKTGERNWEPELYRLWGNVRLLQGADTDEIEQAYARGLVTARAQAAPVLEARLSDELRRLRGRQDGDHATQP